jgi:hypothetical protein
MRGIAAEDADGHDPPVPLAAGSAGHAVRAVDPLKLYDWPGLLTALGVAGPDRSWLGGVLALYRAQRYREQRLITAHGPYGLLQMSRRAREF